MHRAEDLVLERTYSTAATSSIPSRSAISFIRRPGIQEKSSLLSGTEAVSYTHLSYPLSWTVTSLIFIFYYRRSAWLGRCISHSAGASPEKRPKETV